MDCCKTSLANSAESVEAPKSESRRGFLKLAALTGAVVSVSGRRVLANGDIGYHAKDLSDDKLVDMYRTILKIRWHERTQADQMLTNPDYRGHNHFYAGQEAVATASVRRSATVGRSIRSTLSIRRTGHQAMRLPRVWTSRRWPPKTISGPRV